MSWMVHLASSFSDFYSPQLRWESIRSYAKYQFYSNDGVHWHFRMADFAAASYSRNTFYYGNINLEGDNSSVQGGLIATQLLNKLTLSGTASVIKIFSNNEKPPASVGWLLVPVHYSDYKQTNLNLYLEAIGMRGAWKRRLYA